MEAVTVDELRDHLSFTEDNGFIDDAQLALKLNAAQAHVENIIGYRIADVFPDGGCPPALKIAILQLAAWWFEQRETASENSTSEVPFGVSDILREYREYTF